MKRIAFVAFFLAACVVAGRAQESRQDISLSATGVVEPFKASSTDVQVSSNRAFGGLLSYRFMLTPTSAVEANYQLTYENTIRFYTNPTSPPEVHMRFTDGTSLSLKFSVGFKVDGEYYRHEQGEIVTLRNYDPILAL